MESYYQEHEDEYAKALEIPHEIATTHDLPLTPDRISYVDWICLENGMKCVYYQLKDGTEIYGSADNHGWDQRDIYLVLAHLAEYGPYSSCDPCDSSHEPCGDSYNWLFNLIIVICGWFVWYRLR